MNAAVLLAAMLGMVLLIASLLYLRAVNRRARQLRRPLRRPCRCPYCLGGGF